MNLSKIPDGAIYNFRVFTHFVVFFYSLSGNRVEFVGKVLNR